MLFWSFSAGDVLTALVKVLWGKDVQKKERISSFLFFRYQPFLTRLNVVFSTLLPKWVVEKHSKNTIYTMHIYFLRYLIPAIYYWYWNTFVSCCSLYWQLVVLCQPLTGAEWDKKTMIWQWALCTEIPLSSNTITRFGLIKSKLTGSDWAPHLTQIKLAVPSNNVGAPWLGYDEVV